MFKNRINPIRFFGILILSIPVLLSGILFQEFRRREFVTNVIELWHVVVFVMVILGVMTSISLLLKWKYSRLLTNVFMTFISIAFSIFLYDEIKDFKPRDVVTLMAGLFVYLTIIFCFIFINNHYMQIFFKADIALREADIDDILDS